MEYYKRTRNVRWKLLYFLPMFLLINEVSLQKEVEGFIGRSAILPCSYEEPQINMKKTEVSWRHNTQKVYAIINGKGSLEGQQPQYKNRAETFPEEYEKGNFSLKLNNLKHTDAGKYKCYITKESVVEKTVAISLMIKEKEERKGGNEGTKPRPDIIIMIFSLLCIVLSLTNSAT